ncbi:hypothetical protein [Desulfurococcus sp.]|uniref:hypothetical protein n=1 Tax=Desulfurococcus sp. TaxID=51678 RepID=UPI0038574873
MNGFEDRITPINATLSSTRGLIPITISDIDTAFIAKNPLARFGGGKAAVHIKAVTLEDLIRRFELREAVLKMDCEGRE